MGITRIIFFGLCVMIVSASAIPARYPLRRPKHPWSDIPPFVNMRGMTSNTPKLVNNQALGEKSSLNADVYPDQDMGNDIPWSDPVYGGTVRDGANPNARMVRQSRRGLDSLSGTTFGESKRFDPRRMDQIALFKEAVKSNMDEIDATELDDFPKRNFDDIDHGDWDTIVNRHFLASRH